MNIATYTTNPEKVDKQTEAVIETAMKKESALSKEEAKKDYSKMHALDLGKHKNYKTKMIQNRWGQRRDMWLKNP